MSDTDDTEDLLLIPPDFFLVQSEPVPPYYNVVDSLIQQVCDLRDRIEGIESMSDISITSNHHYPQKDSNMFRRFYSHDDLYQPSRSSQSTPQKPRERPHMNSLPNTPSAVKAKKRVHLNTPVKDSPDGDNMFQVQEFLSNVKTLQRTRAARNLEDDFNDPKYETVQTQRYDKDVEETIQEIDRQTEKISLKNSPFNTTQDRVTKVSTWHCGDNIESVPDYGQGMREALYRPKEAPVVTQSKPVVFQSNSSATSMDKSESSSESTQLTAFDRLHNQPEKDRNHLMHSPLHENALELLNQHKKLLESRDSSKIPKNRGVHSLNDNLGLMRLADIWGSVNESPSKLQQKIQEEKLRRLHCEQLIQELQNKNLELQQKLSVAVTVDESKNHTIHEFQRTLQGVSDKLKRLQEEKSGWELEMAKMKNHFSIELESANQKVTYYEKEASRCLGMSQENKEKLNSLEKRCMNLQKELNDIEVKFQEVQNNYQKEYDKNKQLADILSQKEIELKENKQLLSDAREEVAHSRKAVEICQTEFTSHKHECSRLENELKNEKATISKLTEEKMKLLNDLQTYKQNDKKLNEALEQSKVKLDSTKIELKNFYQGQLELIVENKRKEMQHQLDQERQNGLEEVRRKELSMAKTAATHIKDISEKCALETKLLEQKHQEELRLYQVQLITKDKEIEVLKRKLAELPEKRAEIAKQFHKAMEHKLNEALKLISGTQSPFNNEPLPPARAYEGVHNPYNYQQRQSENALEYEETPVSSKIAIKQTESEIQKYINMLLNRAPGNPNEEPRIEGQKMSTNLQNRYEEGENRQPERYSRSKQPPPWK